MTPSSFGSSGKQFQWTYDYAVLSPAARGDEQDAAPWGRSYAPETMVLAVSERYKREP
jgi:hypothetical protein